MQYPQLIVVESTGDLAAQLAELVGEQRWVVRTPKKCDGAQTFARESRPTVLIVEVEPSAEGADAFALIADVRGFSPDVAIVAVSASKLPDADRAAWTAHLFDLGARYVLFPPITQSVLEDIVSGLMAATVLRVVGEEMPKPAPAEKVIDLAHEETDG